MKQKKVIFVLRETARLVCLVCRGNGERVLGVPSKLMEYIANNNNKDQRLLIY